MQLKHHSPAARGVSQLMYVGDVEDAPPSRVALTLAILAGVAWVLWMKR